MSLSVIVTAVLLGQSSFALASDKTALDVTDVAYHELAAGQPQAAVSKLEAGGAARSNDPAALINLGAAYAKAGMADKALAAYRAAVASPDRYDLELADGTWVDSRTAARDALKRMQSARTVASR
jgi:cytochrome c-type biogenesis protein CcmH/NrfG